jgi:teichuronic acid exporter
LITRTTESPEQIDLGIKIISGAAWNSVQLLAGKGFSYLVNLILVKMLLPEHFGIIGMAIVFTGLISAIGDLGLAAALIQYKKDRLLDSHFVTAFWVSLIFNLTIFILLISIIGPFAAWFYGEPILRLVIPVISTSTFLSSLTLIHRIILTRELQFRKLSIIDLFSSIIAGTGAILLAITGAGVWSIAFQSVIMTVVSIPLLWFSNRWLPKLKFSKSALSDIIGFGIYDAVSRTFVYLTKNVDFLLIGKFLGAESVGYYAFAFTLTNLFRQQIMSVMNKIMFPVYGQLQDSLLTVKLYYLKVVRFNTLVIMPVMVILIALIEPIIKLIFGERWILATFPVQAMAIATIIHTIGGTTDSVFKGIGRIDLNVKLLLTRTTLISVPGLIIGLYFYGINGAAVAIIVSKVVTRFMYQSYMKKLIGVTEREILQSLIPAFCGVIATLPVLGSYFLFLDQDNLLILLGVIALVCVSYLLTILMFIKSDIRQLSTIIVHHQPFIRKIYLSRRSR